MSSIKPASQLNADQAAVVADVAKIKSIAQAAGGRQLTATQTIDVRAAEIDIVGHIPSSYQHGMDSQNFTALSSAETDLFNAASGTGSDLTSQVAAFAQTANAAFDSADGAGSGYIPTSASTQDDVNALAADGAAIVSAASPQDNLDALLANGTADLSAVRDQGNLDAIKTDAQTLTGRLRYSAYQQLDATTRAKDDSNNLNASSSELIDALQKE